MTFTKPTANSVESISADGVWPLIVFQTDAQGAHSWHWTVAWEAFFASGTASTPGNAWDATSVLTGRGGTVTVTATAGSSSATITSSIEGTNPAKADVIAYLATKAESDGFERILQQESKFTHFVGSGVPVRSADNGYGMCQLTNPAPTFEQVWNWKRNIDAGLLLFGQKRTAARIYLGQGGRTFTPDQLRYESVCRWNGGPYHRWDAASTRWVRNPIILCDSATGNIGWDLSDAANAGHTEAELHARDSGHYPSSPRPTDHWRYFGVCYADHVLR